MVAGEDDERLLVGWPAPHSPLLHPARRRLLRHQDRSGDAANSRPAYFRDLYDGGRPAGGGPRAAHRQPAHRRVEAGEVDHHHHEDVLHAPRALLKRQVARIAPDFKSDRIAGAIMYYDCQVDDARLVALNIGAVTVLANAVAGRFARVLPFLERSA